MRNLYISKERTFKRKLKEACLAIKLSRRWSKDRILAEYMNQVYYGNHAYGIEAAAQTYFSKHARELGLGQAALLAGLPQAPSIYDPFHRPATALARRDEVLTRDAHDTAYITPRSTAGGVATASLRLKPGKLYTRIQEPYFFSYVRDQLIAEYGANTVRSGGLTRLHDDQPGAAEGRREGDPRHALPAERPGGGRRLDQPRAPARSAR